MASVLRLPYRGGYDAGVFVCISALYKYAAHCGVKYDVLLLLWRPIPGGKYQMCASARTCKPAIAGSTSNRLQLAAVRRQ